MRGKAKGLEEDKLTSSRISSSSTSIAKTVAVLLVGGTISLLDQIGILKRLEEAEAHGGKADKEAQ